MKFYLQPQSGGVRRNVLFILQMRKWGTERLNTLPEIKWQVSGDIGIWNLWIENEICEPSANQVVSFDFLSVTVTSKCVEVTFTVQIPHPSSL